MSRQLYIFGGESVQCSSEHLHEVSGTGVKIRQAFHSAREDQLTRAILTDAKEGFSDWLKRGAPMYGTARSKRHQDAQREYNMRVSKMAERADLGYKAFN